MMKPVMRCGCIVVLLLVLLIVASISLGVMLTRVHAAEEDKSTAILLTEAQPAAPSSDMVRGIFVRRTVNVAVPDRRCEVVLAGDASGQTSFTVDDQLRLVAHDSAGRERSWQHDFRASGEVMSLAPLTVSIWLGTDLHELEVVLQDLQPDTWGNSAIWLLPCANAAALQSTATPLLAPVLVSTRPPTATVVPAPTTSAAVSRAPNTKTPVVTVSDPQDVRLLVALIIGAVVFGFALRLRRVRVQPAADESLAAHLLFVYDVESGEQVQELLPAIQSEAGIARGPLRIVDSAAVSAVCIVKLATQKEPEALELRGTCSTLQISLDGARL